MKRLLLLFLLIPIALFSQVEPNDSLPGKTLRPVQITPSAVDSVWGSKLLNVADFIFYGEDLFLLAYDHEKRFKRSEHAKRTLLEGAKIIQVDRSGNELVWADFGDRIVEKFIKQVEGSVVVACEENMAIVSLKDPGEGITIITKETYLEGIAPIIDSNESFAYITDFKSEIPYCDYYVYNRVTQENKFIAQVQDSVLKDLFNSQYKYLSPRYKRVAAQFEADHGVDRKIVAAYMTSFQNSIYFEELRVPTAYHGGKFYIFNHYGDELLMWVDAEERLYKLPLSYHRKIRHFDNKVWLDKTDGRFYTSSARLGKIVIHRIDLQSGTAREVAELEHRFVDRIEVLDGYVYYIYRPFESSQNRYLYKQRIFERSN